MQIGRYRSGRTQELTVDAQEKILEKILGDEQQSTARATVLRYRRRKEKKEGEWLLLPNLLFLSKRRNVFPRARESGEHGRNENLWHEIPAPEGRRQREVGPPRTPERMLAWAAGTNTWLAPARPLPASAPSRHALLVCSASSDQPALTADVLEDGWRSMRRRMVEGVGRGDQCVPSLPDALADDGAVWAHPITHLEKGCILVCAPHVSFRNPEGASLLERSVLILLEHSKEHGALAIALNRPTENELGDVLERDSLKRAFASHPLHLGGTSSIDGDGRSNVWMLAATRGRTRQEHEEFAGADGAEALLPGLWLGTAFGAAKRVETGDSPSSSFHFYAGAFVWEAGDLEAEIEAGAWYAASASSAALKEYMLGDVATPEAKYQAALGWAKAGDVDVDGNELADTSRHPGGAFGGLDDGIGGGGEEVEDAAGGLFDLGELANLGEGGEGGLGRVDGGGLEISGVAEEKFYGSIRDVQELIVSRGGSATEESKAAKSLMAVRDVLGAVQTWVRLVSETREGRRATQLEEQTSVDAAEEMDEEAVTSGGSDAAVTASSTAGDGARPGARPGAGPSLATIIGAAHRWLLRGDDIYDDTVTCAQEQATWEASVETSLSALAARCLDIIEALEAEDGMAEGDAKAEGKAEGKAESKAESKAEGKAEEGGAPDGARDNARRSPGRVVAADQIRAQRPPVSVAGRVGEWIESLMHRGALSSGGRSGEGNGVGGGSAFGGGVAAAVPSSAAARRPQLALHAIRTVLLEEARALVIPDEQPALEIGHLSLPGRLAALAQAVPQPPKAPGHLAESPPEPPPAPSSAPSSSTSSSSAASSAAQRSTILKKMPPTPETLAAQSARAEATLAAEAVTSAKESLARATLSVELAQESAEICTSEGRPQAARRELRQAEAQLDLDTAALEAALADAEAKLAHAEELEAKAAEAEAIQEAGLKLLEKLTSRTSSRGATTSSSSAAAPTAAASAASEAAELQAGRAVGEAAAVTAGAPTAAGATATAGDAAAASLPDSGPVDLSSLQLGLVTVLLAERIGLKAELVDVDGCGLLLRADLGAADEPLYVSLAPDESCFRTLSRRDCALAVLQLDEPLPASLPDDHLAELLEFVLQPLDIGALLVEEWSEAYRVGGEQVQADFWDVQRHTLRRLAKRLEEASGGGPGGGGRGEDEDGAPRSARVLGKSGVGRPGGPSPGDITGIVLRLPKRMQGPGLPGSEDDYDI